MLCYASPLKSLLVTIIILITTILVPRTVIASPVPIAVIVNVDDAYGIPTGHPPPNPVGKKTLCSALIIRQPGHLTINGIVRDMCQGFEKIVKGETP